MRCTLYATGNSNQAGREYKCKHPGCERVLWFPYNISDEQASMIAVQCGVGRSGPGLASKIMDWGKEIARWELHGRPVRTPEQIAENQEKCRDCEFYNPSKKDENRGFCKLCGCRLNDDENVFNKHYLGTTTCPHPVEPLWLPIVELQDQP